MSLTGKPPGGTVPTMPTGVEVASYATYLEAQKAVDHLSDKAFPVQLVTIVGTDLRLVERITGRLTYARVAGAGAMSGAWFGLMISLLYWIFTPSGEFPLLAGVLIGAAFGILFAIVSYAFTGGKRDFTSASQVVASRYAVLCEPGHAGQAGQLLAEGGFHGRTRPTPPGAPTTPGGPTGGPTGPYGQRAGSGQPGPYGQQVPPGGSGQPGPYGQQVPPAPPGRHADRPASASASPEDAPSPTPGDTPARPTEFGSRPDERPRYGLRLEDLDRGTDGDAPGQAGPQG
ncbi:general stress protein [Georgenia daeguensis]|uniref:General stress protein 17M-like domain-containing protein n=1 Tax=Georgenia daeguensis TaxID=908355 RepID=A0ABP8EUZ3_9MICO